jgi:arginyl-tRNA--protein-N-Asp/Glu arginylyltransferase
MKLKEGQLLFEEITELCYQTEDSRLITFIESINQEIQEAESMEDLVSLAEELQVYVNEAEVQEEQEELFMELQEIIEKLFE